MRYVEARFEQQKREDAYRIYLTDALHAIANNTSQFLGLDGIVTNGLQMQDRFYDILHKKPKEKVQVEENKNLTAEEIAMEMWKRMIKRKK